MSTPPTPAADGGTAGGGTAGGGAAGGGTPRECAGAVLTTLILVAGVANLNLAVTNVALPSIGRQLDTSQTSLNLVAVSFSLGLAGMFRTGLPRVLAEVSEQ